MKESPPVDLLIGIYARSLGLFSRRYYEARAEYEMVACC